METPRAPVNWSATRPRTARNAPLDREGDASAGNAETLRDETAAPTPRHARDESRDARTDGSAAGRRPSRPTPSAPPTSRPSCSRASRTRSSDPLGEDPDRVRRRAAPDRRAGGRARAEMMKRLAEGFATERERPRGPVGPRRGRLHRGPARGAAALPRLLPAAAGRLVVLVRGDHLATRAGGSHAASASTIALGIGLHEMIARCLRAQEALGDRAVEHPGAPRSSRARRAARTASRAGRAATTSTPRRAPRACRGRRAARRTRRRARPSAPCARASTHDVADR